MTLRRRLRHLDEQEFGSRPDLILADGGRGHVSALRQVMAEMDLAYRLPEWSKTIDTGHAAW